jgi:hypothetical protein
MDLLQVFCCSNFNTANEGAFKKGIRFGFTFPINAFITVSKPFYKTVSFRSRERFSKGNNTFIIEQIRLVFFPSATIYFNWLVLLPN